MEVMEALLIHSIKRERGEGWSDLSILVVNMRALTVALALLTAASSTLAVVGPGKVTGNTAGNVNLHSITVSADACLVHDPTLCKDSSGTYFVFCTFIFIPSYFYTAETEVIPRSHRYWN